MTPRDLHIDNVFELHTSEASPARRLLVVFSAANASSFTFFKSTEKMRPDKLYIRDPEGNAWYQNGLRDGENLDDIEARIRGVAKDYREIWMIGSSMGGYAALYFGAKLKAQRVLAIAPQIIVDNRFFRGPRKGVQVQTPDITELVLEAKATQFTIIFGSFDLIDTYNISRLYQGGVIPLHIRVIGYEGQDHMLPIQIEEECTLQHYFQMVLSKTAVPQLSFPCAEGQPLGEERLKELTFYVDCIVAKKFQAAYDGLLDVCEADLNWHAMRYYRLLSGFRAGVDRSDLRVPASHLSDLHPRAIDFAFLAAQCCEETGDVEAARHYLKRVFSIRRSHPPGRAMLERLNEQSKVTAP